MGQSREEKKRKKHEYYLAHKEQHSAKTREWQEANPEKVAEYARKSRKKYYYKHREEAIGRAMEWNRTNKERRLKRKRERRLERYAENPKQMWLYDTLRQSKGRAAKMDLPFEWDCVSELPDTCPVFGLSLVYERGRGKGGRRDSASIDRRDNTKGYVKGNCFVISLRANTLKSNGNYSEFLRLLEYMAA